MDLEIKIKEEPAWLEETTTAPLEVIALKEELKSELTESGSTQENSLELSEDIKGDRFIEEHTDDQLLPYMKEETKSRPDVRNAEHHPPDGAARCFRFNVCGKSFRRKDILEVHTRTHTGEKPFCCTICEKLFIDKSSLLRHARTHTDNKQHCCNVCGKLLSRKSGLALHVLTHTNVRPHWCNVCAKSFNQKCNLTRHMLSHTGEKAYWCIVCGKSFSCKSQLTRHLPSHTGDKAYCCEVCDKSFKRESNLAYHMKSHTRIKLHWQCLWKFLQPEYIFSYSHALSQR